MSELTSWGKHIFQWGADYVIQAIWDKLPFHSAEILEISTVFALVVHAQITAHFGELLMVGKFKSMKTNILKFMKIK